MDSRQASATVYLDELLSRPPRNTALEKFLEGFRAPWEGFRLLRRQRSLWPYAIPPILLNLLITAAVFAVLLVFTFAFAVYWHPWFTANQSGARLALWIAIELLAILLLGVVCIAAAVVTWKLLSGILCGYQYGKLAARTEELLGLAPDRITETSFAYQIADTAIDLGSLVLNAILFTLLGLVPVLGPPLALVGSLYRTWFLLGLDYFDFPLSLRGMRRVDKVRYCRNGRPYVLGLGGSVFLLQFVPILSALLLTTTVIGAVLLHRRIENQRAGEAAAQQSPATRPAVDSP